jgi:flagella basal body P-ring formation protein FlgA
MKSFKFSHPILMTLGLMIIGCVPALAQGNDLVLKSVLTDGDGTITLGDLFDNAAGLSPVIIARRSSQSAVLDAAEVQARVAQSGARWPNHQGLRRIIVRQGTDGALQNQSLTPLIPSDYGAVVQSHAPLIVKGQAISVIWQKGAIRLSLEGIALGPARIGERFKLMNPESKKVFEALLLSDGTALVGTKPSSSF